MILDNLGIFQLLDIRTRWLKRVIWLKQLLILSMSRWLMRVKAADTAALTPLAVVATWENFKEALGSGLAEGTKNPCIIFNTGIADAY